MIRVSKTFTRPNTSTNWWYQTTDGAEFAAYRVATYGNKLSGESSTFSPNGLTWTYIVSWPSEADRNAAHADPVFAAADAKRTSYNAAHGITESASVVTTI